MIYQHINLQIYKDSVAERLYSQFEQEITWLPPVYDTLILKEIAHRTRCEFFNEKDILTKKIDCSMLTEEILKHLNSVVLTGKLREELNDRVHEEIKAVSFNEAAARRWFRLFEQMLKCREWGCDDGVLRNRFGEDMLDFVNRVCILTKQESALYDLRNEIEDLAKFLLDGDFSGDLRSKDPERENLFFCSYLNDLG